MRSSSVGGRPDPALELRPSGGRGRVRLDNVRRMAHDRGAGAAARRAARLCLTADRGSPVGARGRCGPIAAALVRLRGHRPDRDDVGGEQERPRRQASRAASPAPPPLARRRRTPNPRERSAASSEEQRRRRRAVMKPIPIQAGSSGRSSRCSARTIHARRCASRCSRAGDDEQRHHAESQHAGVAAGDDTRSTSRARPPTSIIAPRTWTKSGRFSCRVGIARASGARLPDHVDEDQEHRAVPSGVEHEAAGCDPERRRELRRQARPARPRRAPRAFDAHARSDGRTERRPVSTADGPERRSRRSPSRPRPATPSSADREPDRRRRSRRASRSRPRSRAIGSTRPTPRRPPPAARCAGSRRCRPRRRLMAADERERAEQVQREQPVVRSMPPTIARGSPSGAVDLREHGDSLRP